MQCEWNGCTEHGTYFNVKSNHPDLIVTEHLGEYPISFMGVQRIYCAEHKAAAVQHGFLVTRSPQ